jgi:hypothetical protein
LPLPILGSEGPRGVVTYYNPALVAETLEVHTWDMTGAFEDGAVLTWFIYVGDEFWTDSITMATDLATSGALLAASIEAMMPVDTVEADFLTDTLTLTSEFLGLRFTEDFSTTGEALPVWPTTSNLPATNSYGQALVPALVSSAGRGGWQPAAGRVLEVLPEGERQGNFKMFLTYNTVYTADQFTGRPATITQDWQGVQWKAVHIWETEGGVIDHLTVLQVRLPETLPGPTTPEAGELPEPPPPEE